MDISDETMLRLLQSAMYGEAIGDALGVPYEGRARDTFTCITMTGSEAAGIPAGTFSDDTSMALATLDSLMHRDGVVDPDDLRERYRDWLFDGKYTADGAAFGVGRTTYQALHTDHGLNGERDNGNGALMRSIPLAFFGVSDDDVRAMSAVTHAHETSMDACVRYVRAARALIRGASTREAAAVAAEDGVWLVPRSQIESSGYVLHTLRAALWCLTTTDSYRDCVLTAVNLGGDADTTAAVAGALAGMVYGFEDEREERDGRGIPGEWDDALRGWRIIAAVVCGAPLDVEDWDAELAGSALGGPEALTAQSARDFGDDRCRAALLQADPERREALFGEAARWFASGVELGDAQCATNLGVMYLYGHVPAQDPDFAAAACFERGEQLGSAESACYLGDMHRDGRGWPPDHDAAADCYERAYELCKEQMDLDNAHDRPIIALIHLRIGQAAEWELADLRRAGSLNADACHVVRERAYRHYHAAYALAVRTVESGLRMYSKEVAIAANGMERTCGEER